MSTNVHITHIENAWAAWYANGDHGQISILTDAATGLPYEEFTWKNDDDSKTYIAAAQKYSADGSTFTYLDSDFDALTSQDDTDGFSTAQWIRRIGDTDNRIQLETDEQTYHVGGVDMMNFVEGATDLIEFNPGEVDVDFIVNSLSVSEALSVQGSTGYVGMSMTPATATLSIKANASHYNIDMVENSGADSWQIGVPADGYLELSDDTVHRVRFTETDINNYSYATGGFYGRCSSDTPAEYSRLRLSKTHADTNISTSAGESLCNMIFGGVDNGGNEDTGVIIAVTQVGAAGTKVPTKFELYTSTNAATNLALTIDESQDVIIENTLYQSRDLSGTAYDISHAHAYGDGQSSYVERNYYAAEGTAAAVAGFELADAGNVAYTDKWYLYDGNGSTWEVAGKMECVLDAGFCDVSSIDWVWSTNNIRAAESFQEIFRVGYDGISASREILALDKIKFTQTDGNEYIDSLASGYMDYGATTGHRFKDSDVLTENNLTVGGADIKTGKVTITANGGGDAGSPTSLSTTGYNYIVINSASGGYYLLTGGAEGQILFFHSLNSSATYINSRAIGQNRSQCLIKVASGWSLVEAV